MATINSKQHAGGIQTPNRFIVLMQLSQEVASLLLTYRDLSKTPVLLVCKTSSRPAALECPISRQ